MGLKSIHFLPPFMIKPQDVLALVLLIEKYTGYLLPRVINKNHLLSGCVTNSFLIMSVSFDVFMQHPLYINISSKKGFFLTLN